MTLKEIIDHRVDKDMEVFCLVDKWEECAVSLSLEFEKMRVRLEIFDSREAAEAFLNILPSTEYAGYLGPQNLVVKSMPLSDYIKEYDDYDA